jgi:hypothetical protein
LCGQLYSTSNVLTNCLLTSMESFFFSIDGLCFLYCGRSGIKTVNELLFAKLQYCLKVIKLLKKEELLKVV